MTVIEEFVTRARPLYEDRREAGRDLGAALAGERDSATVVVGLTRGGVEVAAEVARVLRAPLDVVTVRKVVQRRRPEHGLGAVTADGTAYIRARNGVSDDEFAAAIERAAREALVLDERLHAGHPPLVLRGKRVVAVDDGIATGGTMVAALRSMRDAGVDRLVAAVPVAAHETLELIRPETDELVCPHPVSPFFAAAAWYANFAPVGDEEVRRILAASREQQAA